MKVYLKKIKHKYLVLVSKSHLIILDNFNFNKVLDLIYQVIEREYLKKKNFL